MTRTSAPAKVACGAVHADGLALLSEPFVIWGGEADVGALTESEIANIRSFLSLGGVLLVDDFAPEIGTFLSAAKRELLRVLPDGAPIPIDSGSILFKTFYLLTRAEGRVAGRGELEAIVREGVPQVIFSAHDLLGALARGPSGTFAFRPSPGGELQRERSIRLAVNIAMYVLCSTYKEDVVHRSFLRRRRPVEP
jgi:hypothetical protein